jgi:hypothetical protein
MATKARGHRLFAGKIDKSKLGFGERALMVALRVREGDFPGLGGDRCLGEDDRWRDRRGGIE